MKVGKALADVHGDAEPQRKCQGAAGSAAVLPASPLQQGKELGGVAAHEIAHHGYGRGGAQRKASGSRSSARTRACHIQYQAVHAHHFGMVELVF